MPGVTHFSLTPPTADVLSGSNCGHQKTEQEKCSSYSRSSYSTQTGDINFSHFLFLLHERVINYLNIHKPEKNRLNICENEPTLHRYSSHDDTVFLQEKIKLLFNVVFIEVVKQLVIVLVLDSCFGLDASVVND